MFFLRNSLFLVALLLVAVGCSSGDSDDVEAEESSAEEVADSDVDMEELEEEFGVTEGEDAEIPELLPADLYVTDDMEIEHTDRKSTRLNSSHVAISYAVFCLKKKINTRSAN